VVASLTIAGPVIYYLVGGAHAKAELDSLKSWLAVHNAARRCCSSSSASTWPRHSATERMRNDRRIKPHLSDQDELDLNAPLRSLSAQLCPLENMHFSLLGR
jgi:hypothetical protein